MEPLSLVDRTLEHRQDLSDVQSVHSYVTSFSERSTHRSSRSRIDSGIVTTQEMLDSYLTPTTTTTASTERLFDELQRVKDDLQSKDVQIRRAQELRVNTDREIEDLTASLFEVNRSGHVHCLKRACSSSLDGACHGGRRQMCSSQSRREIEDLQRNGK